MQMRSRVVRMIVLLAAGFVLAADGAGDERGSATGEFHVGEVHHIKFIDEKRIAVSSGSNDR